MKKKVFYMLCAFTVIHECHGTLDIRAAIGPAWHQFSSYKTFDLTPAAESAHRYPELEIVSTQFNTLAYGEGKIRVDPCDAINTTIVGGYGKTAHGAGQVHYFVEEHFFSPELKPLQFITPGNLTVSITLFDANIGYKIQPWSYPVTLNFLGGYTVNQEKMCITVAQDPLSYSMKNIWYGPYAGIEGLFYTEKSMVRLWYKCVPGRVNASFNTNASQSFFDIPDVFVIPFDIGKSSWKQKTLGNFFGIEGSYALYCNMSLGTTIQYISFRNRNGAFVHFAQPQPTISTASRVKQIFWQQTMWTFWLEYCY